MKKKLVVIPSDPIHDYEAKGTSFWLEEYYNPNGFFDEVYVLSPKETISRIVYGLKIIPVRTAKEYRNKLKQIKPICVRSYGGYWATEFANSNRIKNIPIISSVHDTSLELMFKSLKYSDHIITMSTVIRDILIREKLATEPKISILGNRVDTAKFDYFPNLNDEDFELFKIPKNKKIVLHIGRKSAEKNIETVIKSLKYLENDTILILIGQGDFIKYKGLISSLKLDDRVFNFEKVENHQLPKLYNLADVFCVPSKWEGFGLVFIEAAACKTKIVTSNIAPINEFLINDGVMNCLLNDFDVPQSIAKAINKLLNNNEINENSREIIVNRFDKSVISKNEVDIYKRLINTKFHKTLEYRIWFIEKRLKTEVYPKLRKTVKLPQRIWKKMLSYL